MVKFSGSFIPLPPVTIISASATSNFPADCETSVAITEKSASVSVISAVSTFDIDPSFAPAAKTFGRRVMTLSGETIFTSASTLPAYMGRVATISPPSILKPVQSAARPASNFTATRAEHSFPSAVAGRRITSTRSFFAISAITFAYAVAEYFSSLGCSTARTRCAPNPPSSAAAA